MADEPHQIGFGVVGDISFGHHRILGLKDNLIIGVDEQRAKRVIAMFAGLPSQGNGRSKVLKVNFVQAMMPNSRALFTACIRPVTPSLPNILVM